MKEPYRWNYNIKVKTKDGTFEYEKEDLSNIDLLLEKHKDYEELYVQHKKVKRLSRNPQPKIGK